MAASTTLLSASAPLPLKDDVRSRTRSPHRARKAREKYWSYRHVNPVHQTAVDHVDTRPELCLNGQTYAYPNWTPCRDACPIVRPSKRQIFKQAQEYPRPPRRHAAPYYTWREGRLNRKVENAAMGMAADWHPGALPNRTANRKVGRSGTKRTGCVVSFRFDDDPFDTTDYSQDFGETCVEEEDALAWEQLVDIEERKERDEAQANALIANLDHAAAKQAAIREKKITKQMQARGWDVVEDYESDFELV